MQRRTFTLGFLALLVAGELGVFLFPPLWAAEQKSTGDYLFLAYLIAHGMWLYALLRHRGRELAFDVYRVPEYLFVFGSTLFLFAYIFATNANLTYAQLFAETSGNLSLAPNSTIQRLAAVIRFGPFLLYDAGVYLFFRIKKPRRFPRLTTPLARKTGIPAASSDRSDPPATLRWALPLALLSGFLYTIALPSFISLRGLGFLSFLSMIPLWFVLIRVSPGWGIFYGLSFGMIQTLLSNFWLGTFSLITLQLVSVFLLSEYLLFFLVVLPLARRLPLPHLWFFPLAWVLFDFLRTQGFLGYPWGMLGSGLYRSPSLIQIADLGGIYLVSFFVLMTNGLLLETGLRLFSSSPSRRELPAERPPGVLARLILRPGIPPALASALRPAAVLALLWLLVLGYGHVMLQHWEGKTPEKTVKIALIQQNTDPRKHDYRRTFNTLKKLTSRVLPEQPDLVAWSETAFVPNIRKWGAMDPEAHSLAHLVRDFHEYQQKIGVWLLTGNDDYEEEIQEDGRLVQSHYNASVLFAPDGRRMDTYRKLHLVPFSEYFPWDEEMPWVFDILQGLDQDLWEKGDRRVIFQHPDFTFFTPICFEDSFPNEVRRFVADGADVILNLSNDYWSLTEVEGEQHFANSLFRAVENRRPLLRSTASGLTASVSPTGEILQQAPYYEEASLVVEVGLHSPASSLYLWFGNWFIIFTALLVGGSALYGIGLSRFRPQGRIKRGKE